jgi:3-methyladenine DNA glycosylase Tag
MERTINQHIDNNRKEIDSTTVSAQRKRHLEDEVESLEKYRENHPGEDHDPTPLELYCDTHPDASECRVYD